MEYVPDVKELEMAGLPAELVSDVVNDTAEAIEAYINNDVAAIAKKRVRPWWTRGFSAGTIVIGKDKIQVKEIKAAEVRAWYRDYVNLWYNHVNPRASTLGWQLFRLGLKYAWENFKFFRAVRERLDSTYGGFTAETESLIMDVLKPKDLNLSEWSKTLTAGTTTDYVSSFTVSTTGGFSIFGVQDYVVLKGYESVVDDIIITKNNITYPARHLDFYNADNGVIDLARFYAWIPKNMTGKIQLYSAAGGDTELRLIGIVICTRSTATAGTARAIST